MNVLVINGSPKGSRSNTMRMTQAFVDGLSAKTSCDIVQLDVNRMELRPCLGCFSCWNKTPGKCCIADDMAQVIEKLVWADVTVWSFPLYYFGIPGPLKNLIDRQLPMNLPFMSADAASGSHPARYDMSGKKTVVISTCGFHTAQGNYDGICATFDHMIGKGKYTALFCGQGELFRVRELSSRTDAYLTLVRHAGEEFAAGGISGSLMEQLSQPLFPKKVYETMADASWGVGPDGEIEEDSLTFTRQMAALYKQNAYPGKDIVLDMHYTDLEKTYQIRLTREGSQVSSTSELPFTTKIHTPYTVWRSIAAGEISGSDALMKHQYRVEGDFSMMLHWDDYFGDPTGAPKTPAPTAAAAKSDMRALLIPWIVFWTAAAIDPFRGSLISLAVCALTPLVFFKSKRVIYDSLSTVLVSLCAIALILGVPAGIGVPLSYLMFGLMWTGSCFIQIPLTAHYSMNDYDGAEALKNPIFMKTNRILTAAWGCLYLLTPIWTYAIMRTGLAPWVGVINSVLPLAMGIFTGWFQHWYPARIAFGSAQEDAV